MALLLNEEQQYLKDTAKEFVQKNAPINHFRELRDSKDKTGYSQDLRLILQPVRNQRILRQ